MSKQLSGKSAVITGSTSGIGLGIARAFAGAGANIMLNGFGDAKEIESLRAGLAAEHGVKVAYSGADMSKLVINEEICVLVFLCLDVFVRQPVNLSRPEKSLQVRRWSWPGFTDKTSSWPVPKLFWICQPLGRFFQLTLTSKSW